MVAPSKRPRPHTALGGAGRLPFHYIVYKWDGSLRYAAPTPQAAAWFLALVKEPNRFAVLIGAKALSDWRKARMWRQYREGGLR